MKIKATLFIALLLSLGSMAQNAINYKAVIKDNVGNVVTNQSVTVQFTILQGVTSVYQETHTPTTDANGLIIVNIGEGTTTDMFSDIDWANDDHFLNVQIDTGSGLVDLGSAQFMAVPYALHAKNVSGLEAVDEGNGLGYRLKDANPIYFGNIGDRAVDLSYGGDAGYDAGLGAYGTGSVAMGQYTSAGNGSVAMGYNSTASGQYATAMGNVTTASGLFSTTAGFYTTASAPYSTAFGSSTIADDQNSLVLGIFNDNTTANNTLFQIGNGANNNNRSNAFVVDNDGIITAPSFDIAEITDDKALITKEFADANYSGGGSGSNPTGLEALDEGNGIGWRMIGRDPTFFGDIGNGAIDFSNADNTSVAFGATGIGAIAMGFENIASGQLSIVMGISSEASNDYAIALGQNNTASGIASIAFGRNSIASGNSATAIGLQTTASGETSVAMGRQTNASGSSSTALGLQTTASGANAASFGFNTVASGTNSYAIGSITKAEALNSFAIGSNNIGGGTPNNWVQTDPLFEIGNGTSVPSNALTILKNGTITAPSFDISEITDPKALITKEFADANYSGGGSGTNPTGLEAIDEGNGIGWRLVGRVDNNYGTIGDSAIDLSISNTPSDFYGATGEYSFAIGIQTTASGLRSAALGNNTVSSGFASTAVGNINTASGRGSFSTGTYAIASGDESSSLGLYTIADDVNSTVVGRYNDNTLSTTTLFQVGNGSGLGRSNAFNIDANGTITAPSFDISEITDPKALVTKEYMDTNGASGLEELNEGNGSGWRLKGSDPLNYGNIGDSAVDLSISNTASTSYGATAVFSTALGYKTTASRGQSTAMGSFTVASGLASTAMGYLTTASGDYSTAMGYNTNASTSYSTALGRNTVASGYNATAMGINTIASNYNSTAMGIGTIASTQSDLIIGEYNVDYSGFQGPVFAIGNGTNNNNRSNAFSVDIVGNALLAGTLIQNSDRRLKKDISDLSYGLQEILELKPVSYHWKRYPNQSKSLGLIAQEVQTVISEIVHVAEDKDKTLSVSYTELIPVLIKAIQEQQVIIDKQNQTISNQDKTNTEQTKLLETLLTRVEVLENKKQVDIKSIAEN